MERSVLGKNQMNECIGAENCTYRNICHQYSQDDSDTKHFHCFLGCKSQRFRMGNVYMSPKDQPNDRLSRGSRNDHMTVRQKKIIFLFKKL